MSDTPYLQPNRLSDVVAAIQFMAMNERSSQSCLQWAQQISGDASKEAHWRAIFDQHKELFRKSPDDADHYALIWRRALPRLYFRPQRRMLLHDEYEALSPDQKRWVSRPPIPESQIKTLVDIAVTLHTSQLDRYRDWRWWVPIAFGFLGSVLGAIIGVLGASHL